VHIWSEHFGSSREDRVDLLRGYADVGVSRVMALLKETATSDEALDAFAADARAAGAELA
jgi:hypothetical protein